MRTQPAMNKSEEQRVMLTGAALALSMVACIMLLCFMSLLLAPFETPLAPERLPAFDAPLLTPLQREEARRSGVGAFEYDGVWYVDHTLPAEYWEAWIG